MRSTLSDKSLIVFDLDGTLTETKSDMKPDMAAALRRLLQVKRVAVIGGASHAQFEEQFIRHLRCSSKLLANLFLFPTTASAFYRYQRGRWKKVYARKLARSQKKRIRAAFQAVFKKIHYARPRKIYGRLIADKGSELSYSFLGQDVVKQLGARGVLLKKAWTRKNAPFKLKVARLVQRRVPDLEVRAAGYTTIDVTRKGLDKAYGLREIRDVLEVPIKNMLFIGDALGPGGNDAPAKTTGVKCIAVRGPADTKKVIARILGDRIS
jgi:HAD superfamily hydrolase (TIGR01484 family)